MCISTLVMLGTPRITRSARTPQKGARDESERDSLFLKYYINDLPSCVNHNSRYFFQDRPLLYPYRQQLRYSLALFHSLYRS